MKSYIVFYSFIFLLFLFSCRGELTVSEKKPENWIVDFKNSYGYITSSGRVMIDYKFDYARKFEGDHAIVTLEDDLQYLIDSTGTIISKGYENLDRENEIDYTNLKEEFFYGIEYKTIRKKQGNKTFVQSKRYHSLIDDSGNVLGEGFSNLGYSSNADKFMVSVSCDTCLNSKRKKYALLDRKGKRVTDWFLDLEEEDHFFVVKPFEAGSESKLVSILDFNGNKILEQFREVKSIQNLKGFYKVDKISSSQKNAIIDSLGNELFVAKHFNVDYYPSQQIFDIEYKDDRGFTKNHELRNKNFKVLRNKKYKDYYFPENSLLIAIPLTEHTYGYFKVSGAKLERLGVYNKGYVWTTKNNALLSLLTWSDRSEQVLRYDIPKFKKSYSKIFKGDKSGVINLQGEVVVKPQYDSISILPTGRIVKYLGDSTIYH